MFLTFLSLRLSNPLQIKSVQPNSTSANGGNEITIMLEHKTRKQLFCKFDDSIVSATRKSKLTFLCRVPHHEPGIVNLTVSDDPDCFDITPKNTVPFEFLPAGDLEDLIPKGFLVFIGIVVLVVAFLYVTSVTYSSNTRNRQEAF